MTKPFLIKIRPKDPDRPPRKQAHCRRCNRTFAEDAFIALDAHEQPYLSCPKCKHTNPFTK
jgi:phage FluMu protein Com